MSKNSWKEGLCCTWQLFYFIIGLAFRCLDYDFEMTKWSVLHDNCNSTGCGVMGTHISLLVMGECGGVLNGL